MQRMRVSVVGEVILASLVVAGVVTVGAFAPNILKLLKPYLKDKKYSHKQAVQRNIDSLVRSGLVTKVLNDKGEFELVLTKRGLWESTIRKPRISAKIHKWDGKWRVVIFDVPNIKGGLRAELTRGMRLYGFHLLQKSVWVYPYRCDEFIAVLREHLEIKGNVLYMVVSELEGDERFRKAFKIQ